MPSKLLQLYAGRCSHGFNRGLALALLLACPAAVPLARAAEAPVNIGSNRQLLVDDYLIDSRRNVELVMHPPERREVVLERTEPWEGSNDTYVSVFKDGDKYRMYYRASPDSEYVKANFKPAPGGPPTWNWTYTAMAESDDGIHWVKPKFGVVDFFGSKENNLVWPTDANKPWRDKNYPGTDIFPFKDPNPDAPASQRYKALANLGEYELVALASPDGIHWNPMQLKPVISYPPPDPMMDPPSLAYWDEHLGKYVAYMRCWRNYRIRGFRRATSSDFIHWTTPEIVEYGDAEVEHLYTNMAIRYDRAPDFTLMFAKRFMPWRKRYAERPAPGLSEVVFLSSRDGINFDRRFMEPFVSPGLDPDNWHDRNPMMARGILHTSPTEMSMYYLEHYHLPTVRVRRVTLRPDGFASLHAPWEGGEFTTKPLTYKGNEIELNYSTSVAGSMLVEIQDENGKPIPGYRLQDCEEIFGDDLDRVVVWRRGHHDVLTPDHKEIPYKPSDFGRALEGRPIRLHFVMKAAHLYAFRIRGLEEEGEVARGAKD